jgi:para-nitrobenzyl esterase
MKRMKMANLLVVALVPFVGSLAQSNFGFPVKATTENGVIEGTYDTESGLQVFLGVPFAKPPVGELRWKAPQPMDNWNGVLQTKKFGARPVQGRIFSDMVFRSEGMNEDCLYLNIWTPAKTNSSGLPVLLYFYGGGYVAGDASEPRYDGASMAKKGIVTITCNYRLNIFGFFSHPELSAEAPYKGSGNYGLLDQNAALRWVAKNIAAFGGDPSRITIAGESAGSISVSAQMASPLSKGLFAAAIGESGAGIDPTLAPVPLAEAVKNGLEFATRAAAPSLATLRAMSTLEIYELYTDSKRFGFPLVIDGYFFTKSIPEAFKAGEQAQVPLLMGWNSAESVGENFMGQQAFTPQRYAQKVKEAYPANYDDVMKAYPGATAQQIEASATALASDRFIVYSSWKWFDLQRKFSSKPVYRYLYSKPRPAAASTSEPKNKTNQQATKIPKTAGAPHACEIEYCLGNLHLVKDFIWTADDYKVSATMQEYFANFIKNGNPNGNGLPDWPAAEKNVEPPAIMIIDTNSRMEKARHEERYLLLDKIYGDK